MRRFLKFGASVLALGFALAASAQDATQRKSQGEPQARPEQKNSGQQQQKAGSQDAQAQQQDQTQRPPAVLLSDWNYDLIYNTGWSGERLMDDAAVIGANGDEIGSVENIIVSDEGRILGIVAQVGGFLDIGDTHVFVPWDQLEFDDGLQRVTIPVTEENVEDYAYKNPVLLKSEADRRQVVSSDLQTGLRSWKATEVIGDRAFMNGDLAYGWVSDLIFTSDGKLHAVVVNADPGFRGGYYAYPFYGYRYGWTPGAPYYRLGYDRTVVLKLDQLDYEKLPGKVVMQNERTASADRQENAAKSDNGSGKKAK